MRIQILVQASSIAHVESESAYLIEHPTGICYQCGSESHIETYVFIYFQVQILNRSELVLLWYLPP